MGAAQVQGFGLGLFVILWKRQLVFFIGGFCMDFKQLYSTMIHLPPFRLLCVGGCWYWNVATLALQVRSSNHSARSIFKNPFQVKCSHRKKHVMQEKYCREALFFVGALLGKASKLQEKNPSPLESSTKYESSSFFFLSSEHFELALIQI
jgi:hypothetical protein